MNFEEIVLDSMEIKMDPVTLQPYSNLPEPKHLDQKFNLAEETEMSSDKCMSNYLIDNIKRTEIKLEASESTANLEKFDICQYEDLIKIETEELIIKEEKKEEEKVSCFLLPDGTRQGNNAVRPKKNKQEEKRKNRFMQDITKNRFVFRNTQTMCKSEFKNLNLQLIKCKSPKVVTSKFKCDQCEYTTAYEVYLKVHRVNHKYLEEDGIFKCDQCLYTTNNQSYLLIHIRVHNRKLKCDQCSYATDYPNYLQTHLLKHNKPEDVHVHLLKHKNLKKVKKFKCDQCEFATAYKYSLKLHFLKHKNPRDIKKLNVINESM